MFSEFFDLLFGYFKGKPYWSWIEPLLTFVALYVSTLVLAYKYIEWQYHYSPQVGLFARSYIVKQISVVFVGLALLVLVFGFTRTAAVGQWTKAGQWMRAGVKRMVLAALVLVLVLGLFVRLTPHSVSHIQIKFLSEPTKFDKYTLTYIIYELNRSQANWHFEINFDTFNSDNLSSAQLSQCDAAPLCYANSVAGNKALIGVTEERLGQDSFWQNAGSVSVISVNEWEAQTSPSVYEYLAYSLIVQSTMIHLNQNCQGLPPDSFQPGRSGYGNLFEFSPRRNAIKASILAAHLTPPGEELLANCFGMEYMSTCNRLLSLDWLRSGRVHDNLDKDFGVKL